MRLLSSELTPSDEVPMLDHLHLFERDADELGPDHPSSEVSFVSSAMAAWGA
jgi:hypothetical protein